MTDTEIRHWMAFESAKKTQNRDLEDFKKNAFMVIRIILAERDQWKALAKKHLDQAQLNLDFQDGCG